ncbi:MAG: glycerate kinase [Bryobacteraceae bacterium]|nr:glycerate kinase [Bryobacteraceae bacterium]MDW8378533.1 glycerate kinase [Bryobacterales bacterium]
MTETKLRRDAIQILRASLAAADPVQAVKRHVHVMGDQLIVGRRRYSLSKFERIFVVGAGKASAAMALPVERMLGRRITAGAINVKYGHTANLKWIELQECGHPVPDRAGLEGTQRIVELVRAAQARDLVLCLISGGGSALLPAPAPGITLEEKQETTKLLLGCGATIHEINVIRKHLSTLKGGQLARLAFPATLVALILSDVIGDKLDVIASGPTAADESTFANALKILEKYALLERVPPAVKARLEAGARGEIAETPKPGAAELSKVQNLIVGSNRLAVDAAQRKAQQLGYRTLVLSTSISGETRDIAAMHGAIAREIVESGRPVRRPACVISGGETTVTLRGSGKGGRNQEFALAAAIEIGGLERTVILSAGTDGTDGPTDAAGAVCDGRTVERAERKGLNVFDFLARNDSYHFFDALGDLLRTGPTNTNVMDIRLILVG